jgi:hypothetical protein
MMAAKLDPQPQPHNRVKTEQHPIVEVQLTMANILKPLGLLLPVEGDNQLAKTK